MDRLRADDAGRCYATVTVLHNGNGAAQERLPSGDDCSSMAQADTASHGVTQRSRCYTMVRVPHRSGCPLARTAARWRRRTPRGTVLHNDNGVTQR
eukprot:9483801-Pyramimonas_sp.AAC.1